jgi:hypothetical protein
VAITSTESAIDWGAKRHYNLYSQGDPISKRVIVERARKELGWGPSAQPPVPGDFFPGTHHLTDSVDSPLARYQVEMNKRVWKYLRSLDLEDVSSIEDPGPLKCQLIVNDPGGGPDHDFNFYLAHPRLPDWVSKYTKLYNKEYGTDHRYWGVPAYAEGTFHFSKLNLSLAPNGLGSCSGAVISGSRDPRPGVGCHARRHARGVLDGAFHLDVHSARCG